MKKTRLIITIVVAVFLFVISITAIIKDMANVALMATGGIGTIGGGYQLSQGYTKSQFIKANPKHQNLEG